MNKIIFIILLFTCEKIFSQNYLFNIPKGYELTTSKIESDFDDDSIKDLAIILTDTNSNPNLFIFLSSNFNRNKSYQFCEWSLMVHLFSYENNVLTLISTLGGASTMSVNCSIKLKYNNKNKKMEIINTDVKVTIITKTLANQ